MSIHIHKERCVGCEKCIKVCPGNLIKLGEDEKAWIKYPKNCWGCTSCVKECNSKAIAFYLGADMGGLGSKLYTKQKKDSITWLLECENGETQMIEVQRKSANKY